MEDIGDNTMVYTKITGNAVRLISDESEGGSLRQLSVSQSYTTAHDTTDTIANQAKSELALLYDFSI